MNALSIREVLYHKCSSDTESRVRGERTRVSAWTFDPNQSLNPDNADSLLPDSTGTMWYNSYTLDPRGLDGVEAEISGITPAIPLRLLVTRVRLLAVPGPA